MQVFDGCFLIGTVILRLGFLCVLFMTKFSMASGSRMLFQNTKLENIPDLLLNRSSFE